MTILLLVQNSEDRMMLLDFTKLAARATIAAAPLALAGCMTNQGARIPATGVCDTAAAQRLVGEVKPTDAEAMRLTGATIVRQIGPGDPVTQDLRDNRVTIETDPVSGRVARATCG